MDPMHILVLALGALITIDKIAHTFGVIAPLTHALRALGDNAVANAAKTSGKLDDVLAAAASSAAHQAADLIDAGKDADALKILQGFASARGGK